MHTNMKKTYLSFIISLILLIFATPNVKADNFFQLPIIPDSLSFNNRINYLITHYWDYCDLKKAFSSKQKIVAAFKEYLDLMPLASRDTAMPAIDKFIKSIDKPENIITIVSAAEDYIHSDTSSVYSDELYFPFVKAAATNKKLSSAQKARYEHQYKVLSNSMVNMKMPNIEFIDRYNNRNSLYTDSAKVIIVYLFDTDCEDCAMTKIRLDADVNTTKLIDTGTLKIIALTNSAPDGEFLERVKTYPKSWVVGANPELDEIIDIQSVPAFYILDNTHTIFGKNLVLDQVLAINRQLAESVRDPYVKKLWDEKRNNASLENESSGSDKK